QFEGVAGADDSQRHFGPFEAQDALGQHWKAVGRQAPLDQPVAQVRQPLLDVRRNSGGGGRPLVANRLPRFAGRLGQELAGGLDGVEPWPSFALSAARSESSVDSDSSAANLSSRVSCSRLA